MMLTSSMRWKIYQPMVESYCAERSITSFNHWTSNNKTSHLEETPVPPLTPEMTSNLCMWVVSMQQGIIQLKTGNKPQSTTSGPWKSLTMHLKDIKCIKYML